MQEWVNQVLSSAEFSAIMLPAAFVLGLIGAVGSACNIAVFAAIAGYSGSREYQQRRDVYLTSVFFLLGTVVALAALGALVGYFGQVLGGQLGRYGKIFAGFVAILFGISVLNLLPFRMPSFDFTKNRRKSGLMGSAVFGFAFGGASVTCTMVCCGAMLPIVLGVAAIKGNVVWGALIMAMFALGYSTPFVLAMFGVGLGKISLLANKPAKPLRYIGGVLLIGAGFWILTTI